MLLVYFEPAYFSQIHFLDMAFDLLKLASFAFSMFLLVKGGKYPVVYICTLFYYALLLAITYIMAGDVRTVFLQMISASGAVATLFLMSIYIRDWYIKCVITIFELLVYCNCLSVIIAPYGLYRYRTDTGWWTDACWFLGIRNGMSLTYIIMFYLEWLNYYLDKKEKNRFILYMVISSFTIFRINFSSANLIGSGSAGGLVICWTCVLLYYLVPKKLPFLDFFTAYILNICLFIFLVFFKIQRLFSTILEKYLHKSASLSGRTYLWERAIKQVQKSPWYGYGVEYGRDMAERLKTPASVNTTQNGFLDILYTGGAVLFIAFLITVFICAFLLNKYSLNTEVNFFVGYVTFIFFLCCQSESLVGVRFFFYLQLLVMNAEYLHEENMHEKKQGVFV